jgi:hypothetical protein
VLVCDSHAGQHRPNSARVNWHCVRLRVHGLRAIVTTICQPSHPLIGIMGCYMTAPFTLSEHIPPSRLLAVAEEKDAAFTSEELAHFRSCDACTELFREFVRDIIYGRRKKSSRPGA